MMASFKELNIGRLVSEIETQIAVCEREIAQRQEVLQKLRAAHSSLLSQGPLALYAGTADTLKVPEPKSSRRRERKGSQAHAIRAFTREALRREGRPLQRAELLRLLEREGVKLTAKDPERRITKVLSQSGEYENHGDGYWFKGETLPDQG